MNANLRYFLLVAEELNITRAAKKVYVSPQSMSAHIKRLEAHYNVQLFIRKPRFELTPEGRILYEAVKKMQLTERDVEMRLHNIGQGLEGTIKLGIDPTRGQLMLQDIYLDFHKKYPNITIEMVNGYTPDLMPKVIHGELHIMFGPYWMHIQELESILVQKEQYFYVVSDRLLKEQYGAEWQTKKKKMKLGIDIKDVQEIPLILTGDESYMYQQIIRLFLDHHVSPKISFRSNIHTINLEMAASGIGACFCPGMLAGATLNKIVPYDRNKSDLCAYPIKDFKESHSIVLLYRKDGYLPPYVSTFMNWILHSYQQL